MAKEGNGEGDDEGLKIYTRKRKGKSDPAEPSDDESGRQGSIENKLLSEITEECDAGRIVRKDITVVETKSSDFLVVTSSNFPDEKRRRSLTGSTSETNMMEENAARGKDVKDVLMVETPASGLICRPTTEGSLKNIAVSSKGTSSNGDHVKDDSLVQIEEQCLQEGRSEMNKVDVMVQDSSHMNKERPSSSTPSHSCSEQKSAEAETKREEKKKLLILDLNGLLADIVYKPPGYVPEKLVSGKAVIKRPFCDDFLRFCFETFEVGVWSSRLKKNVDMVVDYLMGSERRKLLFCWDQSHCTDTGETTKDNNERPFLMKELKKLWDKADPNLPWNIGEYNETNTLLLDDSPSKALRNPPNTAIFPHTYRFKDVNDKALGPGGDLRVYLEGLACAENVQKYVEQNPFGQEAITESHPSWDFYRKFI